MPSTTKNKRLIIVTGLSGSGKSIALHTLEDINYYCIDNLPVAMLKGIGDQLAGMWGELHRKVAVGIDARNNPEDLKHFPEMIKSIRKHGTQIDMIYLKAETSTLLKRFSETRRRHPLTNELVSLADAIELEKELLEPISDQTDLFIDTSHTTIYELSELVRQRVLHDEARTLSILFQSFGFKHGVPGDTDYLFDVRCLPNPHWQAELRHLTGRDQAVVDYLEQHELVHDMHRQIAEFLQHWVPVFERENRSYLNISIGCTGGQHRSVYLAEVLAQDFRKTRPEVLVRHRELS